MMITYYNLLRIACELSFAAVPLQIIPRSGIMMPPLPLTSCLNSLPLVFQGGQGFQLLDSYTERSRHQLRENVFEEKQID